MKRARTSWLTVVATVGTVAGCKQPSEPAAPPRTAAPATRPAPEVAPPSRPGCAVVPAADPTHPDLAIDLDGDGAPDPLVASGCDAEGRCDWAAFTVADGCATPRGIIARTAHVAPLPLVASGIHLVRTVARDAHYQTEAVLAWTGTTWIHVFDGKCPPHGAPLTCPEPGHAAMLASGAPAPGLPCVTAPAAPAPTVDVDGDGAADVLVAVACGAEGGMCGSIVLAKVGGCTRPTGILPPGVVSVPPGRTPGDATVLVRQAAADGRAHETELRFAFDDWQIVRERACRGGTCDRWAAPDRGAE